jgi:hypothetical protein
VLKDKGNRALFFELKGRDEFNYVEYEKNA